MKIIKILVGLVGFVFSVILFIMTIFAGTGPNWNDSFILMGIFGFITLGVFFLSIREVIDGLGFNQNPIDSGGRIKSQGIRHDLRAFGLAMLVMWIGTVLIGAIPFLNNFSLIESFHSQRIAELSILLGPALLLFRIFLLFFVLRRDYSIKKKTVYSLLIMLAFGLFI